MQIAGEPLGRVIDRFGVKVGPPTIYARCPVSPQADMAGRFMGARLERSIAPQGWLCEKSAALYEPANPPRSNVLFLIYQGRRNVRGLTVLTSIQNNSGPPQGPSHQSEAG
jgi:hypothetical protein